MMKDNYNLFELINTFQERGDNSSGTLLIMCTNKIRWSVTTESVFVYTKLLQFYCIFFES